MSKLYRIIDYKYDFEQEKIVKIIERKIKAYSCLKSQKTAESTWKIFREWHLSEGKNRPLKDFTPLDADDYFVWFRQRKGVSARVKKAVTVSHSTIKKNAALLTTLWNALFQELRIVQYNPWKPTVKKYGRGLISQRRPTELTPYDRIIDLLKAPNTFRERGKRDVAILALMYGGGLRRDELPPLNMGNIYLEDDHFLLQLYDTKNLNDYIQPISPDFTPFILPYHELRTSLKHEFQAYFINFHVHSDTPIYTRYNESSIYKMFCAYRDKIGLPKSITPHSARATPITKLLDSNVSHRDVMIFSRHSSITSVETYDKKKKDKERNPFKLLKLK